MGGVSLVGWMLPQPQHPLSDELMCWGCVLWEGKCRVAGPDSSHCYVPSISFIGHEAGGKAGDCAGNPSKIQVLWQRGGRWTLMSLPISLNLSSSEFSLV